MQKIVRFLLRTAVAVVMLTVHPLSFGGCNCGAEYIIVEDGGHSRIIATVAARESTIDTYATFYDYFSGYDWVKTNLDWGYQVNVIVSSSGCRTSKGDSCYQEN